MLKNDIKGKNIFMTGGCGFIGSSLIERFIDDNRIWCYDNGRRVSSAFKELLKHKNLTFIKGDILDKARLKGIMPKKADAVIHLAAIAGVSSYYKMPFETMNVNLVGTHNLLELLKGKKIEIFVDFSTSEVYGQDARNVSEESPTSQGPISDLRWTYAISKLAAEEMGHCYYLKYGLPVVSIRPFNVYGPLQIGEGAIQIFVSRALKGQDLYIDGDGSQVRAWCYIDDLISGVVNCMKKKNIAIGNVFNLGNPAAAVNMVELAKRIIEISRSRSKIRFRKESRTDIEYRVPDISKAKALIGFKPSIGLSEGLKRTIEYYRENPA